MWRSHSSTPGVDPRPCPMSFKEQEAFAARCSPQGQGGTGEPRPPSYTGRAANHDPKMSFNPRSSVRFANLEILLAFRTVIYCMFCHSKYFPKGHAKFTPELPGSDNRLLTAPSVPLPVPPGCRAGVQKDISFSSALQGRGDHGHEQQKKRTTKGGFPHPGGGMGCGSWPGLQGDVNSWRAPTLCFASHTARDRK